MDINFLQNIVKSIHHFIEENDIQNLKYQNVLTYIYISI